MGGKYKYLLKNIGLMTISNFTSKILSFLLVPLYTSALSTNEYGIYDIYTTTAFLLVPLLSVCISNATLRFTLDKTNKPREIFRICIGYYIRACVIVTFAICVNAIFNLVHIFNEYPIYFILYYALCLLSDILVSFARGLEKIFDVAVAGILSSLATISLNILLLVIFPIGIQGYFIANCAAFAAMCVYLILRLKLWKYFASPLKKQLRNEMEEYSRPLIFDQIAWWINNVSDRYIVTWLCGTADNGIYSVAYKIPSFLSIFQTIFNQAWSLSAVKELDDKANDFYTIVYKMYNCILVLFCALLIFADKFIAKMLYAKDFYTAWMYAPFLTVSVIFGCLSGMFEGVFIAAKKTKIMASSTLVGAGLNTILNIVLVWWFGPIGAAIATLISYIFVWAIRMNKVRSLIELDICLKRDVFSYFLLIIQAVIMLSQLKMWIVYTIEILIIIFHILLYADDIIQIIKTKSKLSHKSEKSGKLL